MRLPGAPRHREAVFRWGGCGGQVYTRTGDDGSTGLGSGERVSKADLRIEAYGTVDELNAQIGAVRAAAAAAPIPDMLAAVQEELFRLGAELAAAPGRAQQQILLETERIARLEREIDELEGGLPPLRQFVLPAGTVAAATLHVARTVCRRAERCLVRLAARDPVREEGLHYLNRLSDLLFVMARHENARRGSGDVPWVPEPS